MDIKRDYSEMNISSDQGVDINKDMIGLFYEDISYATDGGLYAEQIENRSKLFPFIKKMGQPGR